MSNKDEETPNGLMKEGGNRLMTLVTSDFVQGDTS